VSKAPKYIKAKCITCKAEFMTAPPYGEYCSSKCRAKRWRENNLELVRELDRERYKRDKEKRKRVAREYHHKNKEQQNTRRKEHYHKNIEYYKEMGRAKYQEKKNEILQKMQIYYKENRDEILAKCARWRDNNRDKIKVLDARRFIKQHYLPEEYLEVVLMNRALKKELSELGFYDNHYGSCYAKRKEKG